MTEFFIDPVIARAHTPDSSLYTSEEVFRRCKEKVFASSWQFIGDRSLLKENGHAHPVMLLEGFVDEPLVLTKNHNGTIHLLSNVCTHRGNLVVEKQCKVSHLRCRYHGRMFDTNGTFHSMPEFKEVENFPSESDHLKELKLFSWSNWLFTSLNNSFAPELFFGDMMKRVAWMPLDQFVFRADLSRDYEVNANWALYCENYLEGFHIPFVHAGLNAVIDYGTYATELFFPYSSLQIGIAKKDEDCFDLPASSPDFGKKIAAYYFWIFPNMMFNFYPWGLSVNVVKPLSTDRCKVSFISYVWNESKLQQGAGAALDKVELEDEEIVQQVQKGVRSRFYKKGRYSVTREQGTHHFHRILVDFLK